MCAKQVILTKDAKLSGVSLEELRAAAIVAAESGGVREVWFKAFQVGGRQFALSARVVIEVDYFPNRAPDRVLTHGTR